MMKVRFAGNSFLAIMIYIVIAGWFCTNEGNENEIRYPLYPATLDTHPDISSPYVTTSGTEMIVAVMNDGQYAIVPVTQENGDIPDYDRLKMGKGMQINPDSSDFPAFAETGLHADEELLSTGSITGIPVDDITASGRPDEYSRAGFMAADEDIIAVLRGDNDLVRRMELTHPDIAKPLFHVWNLVLKGIEYEKWTSDAMDIDYILYNGRKIHLKFGGRGWQRSIFNDGIMGAYHLEMRRELDEAEVTLLHEKYAGLTETQMNELIEKLSFIHTGEMVPYYINWYGFYEGHTSFRADPLAIASVFGLKSIEDLETHFPGRLYEVLTGHFNTK
ncbi:MAG: hypothetical protein V2J62_01030 [candidate division KSB1 bacterium]|jgi:hypothetical protein|nr:hypothetical protein [candidate division KSB1 bacterium]